MEKSEIKELVKNIKNKRKNRYQYQWSSKTISFSSKKIRAKWTREMIEDIQKHYNVDIMKEMENAIKN